MRTWTARLTELGLTLPAVTPPGAGAAPAVLSGGHVHTAGQLPLVDGILPVTGSVGAGVSVEEAADLARTCALNALSAVHAAVGVDTVVRVVRLVGYVASAEGFTGQSEVLDGASELLDQVFGELGRPARTVVGVTALPFGSPVELELLVAVAPPTEPPVARIRAAARPGWSGAPRPADVPGARGGRTGTLGLHRPTTPPAVEATVTVRPVDPGAVVRVGAPPAGTLVGRDRELAELRSFLDRAAGGGAALLLVGDAGSGRTALLDAAAAAAVVAGTRVLRAAGTELEAGSGFSGLHQLLLPLAGTAQRLPAPQRAALSVALGLTPGTAPGGLVVSTAALALLEEAAAERPLLVVVDDAHWLDGASVEVLGFVARRLAGTRVGFLAATRPGRPRPVDRAGLPVCEVPPLDERAATALLAARHPTLAAPVRRRMLAEAQGNPLALADLPAALSARQRGGGEPLPAVLPLTGRLRAAFTRPVSDLPVACRQLLLLAVLDGTGDPRALRAAARGPGGLDDLAPAERAGLAYVDRRTRRIAFHHPLVRSAVLELSTADERRRGHQALAELWADQPERRARHLAEATVEPDEQVAALVRRAALTGLRRGDTTGAVSGLIRAAELTPHGPDRSRRLTEAAYIGAQVTGALRTGPDLLAAARRADPGRPGSLDDALAASFLLIHGEGDVDTAHRLLVEAMDQPGADDVLRAEALHNLLLVNHFGGRPGLWEGFGAAVARLDPPSTVLSLLAGTFPDPARTAPGTVADLDAAVAGLRDEADPTQIVRVATAAFYLDRLAGCREALWRVVLDGRRGGAVALAIHATLLLAFDDILTGQWDEADRLLAEGVGLGETHGYLLLAVPGRYGQALLAASRGDTATARTLTDAMAGWAVPRGVRVAQAYAGHVRAVAALGRGDYEEAYEQAVTVTRPGELAAHAPHALWVTMDLVEAAVRTRREAAATAHVEALRRAGVAALSPRLALLVAGAAALAAPDADAPALFEAALAVPGADRWAFDLARIRLAYGERLRRTGSPTEARTQLAAALEAFDRLGVAPWSARAAAELRASGRTRSRSDRSEPAVLTPQEREIAELAASGLSNKQIGERLFLSPRTVGAHLYRVFPKLGITSRAALRDALGGLAVRSG